MKGKFIYGEIDGSEICVHLSDKAVYELDKKKNPMYIGLELYFTYFMRKKVLFFDQKPDKNVVKFNDNLFLYFSPLQTKTCHIKDLKGDETDLIEIPVLRKGALIPKYVKIDRKKGNWWGDFTWKSGNSDFKPFPTNQIDIN